MSTLTPRERKTAYAAFGFFAAGCLMVVLLQATVGLYFTKHYFVAHFLLGLFLPFAIYAIGGMHLTFWIGWCLTAAWHFGYEFWEDQLTRASYSPDWDQIASGSVGLLAAWQVYRLWNRHLDRRESASAGKG